MNNVEGAKQGILFYGTTGGQSLPWGSSSSSYLCVKAPTQRTGAQVATGAPAVCDGTLTCDFNAFLNNNLALGEPFSAGQHIYFQGWFRDPPAPKTTSLSNALDMTFQP
ncbi:MAG TPA: hypothetical protein VL326_25970 [Kofleriaceae bacterium]|nr:hypothetical protein [Kofleriaceae bacterium]